MIFKLLLIILSIFFVFCAPIDYRQSLQDGSKFAVFYIKGDVSNDSLLILRIKSCRFKYWGTAYAGDGEHGTSYPVEEDLPKEWVLSNDNKDYSFKLDSNFASVCTLKVTIGKQITLTGHSADTNNFKNSSFWADAIIPPQPKYLKENDSINILKSDNVDFFRITYSDSNDLSKIVFYSGILDTLPTKLIDHLKGTYYNYEPPSSSQFNSPIKIPNSFVSNGGFISIDFCNMFNDFERLLIDSSNNIFIPFTCYNCNNTNQSGNINGGAKGIFVISNKYKFDVQ